MEDFNSKYTGEQVEALLDQVASGNAGGGGGGGITVETDPIFSASPAASITDEKMAEWDGKQDAITDLDTIREGAAKGATALQEETYKGTVTGVKVNGETKSPSDGVVDLGSVGTYSKPSTGIPNSDLSEELREKLETAHRNAMAYQGTVTNIKINGVTKSADNGVIDLGNLGTYSKPSTGIPKSDLNPSVQTSLGKADTAVQPEDIKDEMYITDFDVLSLDLLAGNHISSLEFNKQGLMDALVEHKVILVPYEISDNVTVKGYCTLVGFYEDLLYIKVIAEYSEFIVETALNTQYILNQEITIRNWFDKQDTLVSGENIKTINGESILGEGNIEISGGSGEQGPQGDKGDKGDKGDTGTGVQSVKQTTISNTDGGSNVVTVTLTNGTTSTFTVKNGSKGSTGANGANGKDGADGATFTPSVDSAGNLSWTNDKGLTNPPTVNIKGPKGDKGDAGEGGGSSGGGVPVIAVTIHMGELGFTEHTIPLEPDKIYYANESIEMVYIYTVTPPTGDVGKYSVHFTTTSIVLGFECPQNWLWANGTTPTLEPSTTYELSVVATKFGDDYIYKAVITPFKAL